MSPRVRSIFLVKTTVSLPSCSSLFPSPLVSLLPVSRQASKQYILRSFIADVRFAFHCLSLHEIREPYSPTLMRGTNVYQVSFPGSHGNLGKIEETESLVHAPFAWMIQQVHAHLNICFDEAKLAGRFPSYRPPPLFSSRPPVPNPNQTPTAPPQPSPKWYYGRIENINSGLLAIMGKKARQPGSINNPSSATTDLQVHIGARLRNDLDGTKTVQGYTLMAPVTGMPYWARWIPHSRRGWRGTRTDSESSLSGGSRPSKTHSYNSNLGPRMADRIEEAKVGALEARLLGLPDEVVEVVDGPRAHGAAAVGG